MPSPNDQAPPTPSPHRLLLYKPVWIQLRGLTGPTEIRGSFSLCFRNVNKNILTSLLLQPVLTNPESPEAPPTKNRTEPPQT
ncbi:Hypothetical predicted protein [Xyrichtys novacula]|uniref:Uncharacterized protein n=1 Tax=Xyrichtys novacula TaxID=13765 RepID=A0AAV1GWL0_XYRNO|nr:Hypothetical predicted protein [Xyrichtys novacula]